VITALLSPEELREAERRYQELWRRTLYLYSLLIEQAKTQADRDYDELTAAADKKQQLTAEQEAELTRLWKKLVKLYHPDRFANEPDKLRRSKDSQLTFRPSLRAHSRCVLEFALACRMW
jgi:hypothetical protein